MWIFSNKTPSSIGASITSALGATGDDVLSAYTIEPPPSGCTPRDFSTAFRLHWILQEASNRKSNEKVSIFTCTNWSSLSTSSISTDIVESLLQTVKRMKTLRHPNILTWLGGTSLSNSPDQNCKLPSAFHLVTERVVPLEEYLRTQADKANFNFLASWGIYQIARAVLFLNDDCNLAHNHICSSSVFVNRSGEWKLSNLDYVTSISEAGGRTDAFEDKRSAAFSPSPGIFSDAWGLGVLIWQIFNPAGLDSLSGASELTSASSLQRLPKSLHRDYRRLLSAKRAFLSQKPSRSPIGDFIKSGRKSDVTTSSNGFLSNDYIDILLFLEEIQIKDKEEKLQFLSSLGDRVSMFPDDICRYKILPHLVTSLQYGSAGVEALVPVLELTHLLSQADFDSVVLPGLVKLFASPDRATRVRLLDQLPRFVEHLPGSTVETQIFPPVAAGFSDANPLVREATIRSMVFLAPCLSSKTLNNILIRHLTHLQFKDEQGGIRANATICLAKIAGYLDASIRRGALLNAFLRATRDPFPPSRQAAATSLAASQAFFSTEELAGKVIPCLSFLAVDSEKDIRTLALKALRDMLQRLEKANDDPSESEADLSVVGGENCGRQEILKFGTPTVGGFGSWAFGALSSISSRIVTSSKSSNVATPQGDSSEQKESLNSPKQGESSEASYLASTEPKKLSITTKIEPSSISKNTLLGDKLRSLDVECEDGDDGDSWGSLEDVTCSKKATQIAPSSTSRKPDLLQTKSSDWLSDWSTDDTKSNVNASDFFDEVIPRSVGHVLKPAARKSSLDPLSSNSVKTRDVPPKSLGNVLKPPSPDAISTPAKAQQHPNVSPKDAKSNVSDSSFFDDVLPKSVGSVLKPTSVTPSKSSKGHLPSKSVNEQPKLRVAADPVKNLKSVSQTDEDDWGSW